MRLLKSFIFLLCFFSGAVFADDTIYTESKSAVVVTAENPTFTVKLKSNPTTGYAWSLRHYNSRLLKPVTHKFEAPTNTKMVGAPGFEVWTFKMKPTAFVVPQQTIIRFIYARPWEKADKTAKKVVFKVTTSVAVKQ